MFDVSRRRIVCTVSRSLLLATFLVADAPSLLAGQTGDGHIGPSLEGTPGLFKTWDAEPVRRGEVFFSAGLVRVRRDPGELSITTAAGGGAIGIFDWLEVFGLWELQKRIQADGIQVYRIVPGQKPRIATTRTGDQLASSSAPFMDVPMSTGRGELYGYIKVNLLSERRGRSFALSAVATGKIPGYRTFKQLNRGLTTGDTELGFGALVSKRLPGIATLHVNSLVIFVGHPEIGGVGISDLQNRFVLRAGAAFPVSPRVEGIAEFERFDYFFHQTIEGLNPTRPLDVFLGLRVHPSRTLSLSGGYSALVNRIEENPARAVRPVSPHGFVVQMGLALRRD